MIRAFVDPVDDETEFGMVYSHLINPIGRRIGWRTSNIGISGKGKWSVARFSYTRWYKETENYVLLFFSSRQTSSTIRRTSKAFSATINQFQLPANSYNMVLLNHLAIFGLMGSALAVPRYDGVPMPPDTSSGNSTAAGCGEINIFYTYAKDYTLSMKDRQY